MNVSLAWLRDFVKTPTAGTALGERFRMTSSECEGVTDWSAKLAGLVIGQVTKIEPHPNADRLQVATVQLGTHTRTIVCGAPNLTVEQFVIVATPGAVLHPVSGGEITIQETSIRGVQSQGMICSLEEIGVPVASEGIFVLESPAPLGYSAAEILFEDDAVIDLEITPNRPDLLSHYGLAREVASFEQRRLDELVIGGVEQARVNKAPEIKLAGHKECLRYSAVVVSDLTIKPSPWWLQSRLIRCGIRPINVVVDVTNYVMLELGQPLHAFDADMLSANGKALSIGVRLSTAGEEIMLLDGTNRKLEGGDILITDNADKPVALAGIMGAASSAVTDTTKQIVLESAVFSAAHIRRTSRSLGLRSEASLRFEKGLDPELTVTALKRAAHLLADLAGGKITSRVADSSIHPPAKHRIRVSFDQIHQILGVRISAADCKTILHKLGFTLPVLTKSAFEAVPPSWRRDVTLPEDIIEELIRIWGFEHLPSTLPVGAVKPPRPNSTFVRKNKLRRALVAAGFHETVHSPFCSAQDLEKAGFDVKKALALPNPLSQEGSHLAPSHVIGMLNDCAATNGEHEELALGEIGKTFVAPHGESETLTLFVRSTTEAEPLISRLKTVLLRLTQELHLPPPTYQVGDSFQITTCLVADEIIGILKIVDPIIVANFKIKRGRTIVVAELNLATLLHLEELPRFYQSVSQYPTSTRDLTITIGLNTSISTLEEVFAKSYNPDLVQRSFVQTIYRGKPLEKGERSVTFRTVYGSPERTLTEEEIKAHQAKLIQALNTYGRTA